MKKEFSLLRILFFLILSFVIFKCKSPVNNDSYAESDTIDIFEYNKELGRGINLGNALEAPSEGDWGVTIREEHFSIIKKAGFYNVRIPIRWSAHTLVDSPYTINHNFMNRVDQVIYQALNNELKVVINVHHYNEIMENPDEEKAKLYSIWRQLSSHYQDFSAHLSFEILNEPNDQLTPELWNVYSADLVEIIRNKNSMRPIIIGTASWGGLSSLSDLVLPEDNGIILTLHYYEPFQFTHQGAEWVDGSDEWLGTIWRNKATEVQSIVSDFITIDQWAAANNVPVFIGEFGAYSRADSTSRHLWTERVREEAESRNFSWAYWEFCSGFGAYDDQAGQWRNFLLKALIPE